MIKNTSGQKWTVFAFNRSTGEPATGESANITANLRIDDGTASAIADTNPTEQEDGYYVFDMTQAETNGIKLSIFPACSTSGVQVVGCPAVIYTEVLTGDAYSILSNETYGLSAIETLVDELESRLTAARAANLDELGSLNIPADIDTLLSRITAAVALNSDMSTLLSRISALRAGYLDNLSAGAVATSTEIEAIPTASEIVTALLAGTYGDGTLKLSDLLIILSGIFGGKMTSTLDETQSGTVTFYNKANEAVVTATFVNGGRTAVVWNKVA